MKISKHEQGTQEWLDERCGIPTSSNFSQIITTKGIRAASRNKYLYKTAGELILEHAEPTYQNAAMLRGTELEPEARNAYELITGNDVVKVGLCIEKGSGASPDGLVGDSGLLEIKCPMIATHIGYLLQNKAPTDYFQQMQGQLLITGREWVDFVSYYPGLKTLIVRVERNEEFIKKLQEELKTFNKDLKEIVKTIK